MSKLKVYLEDLRDTLAKIKPKGGTKVPMDPTLKMDKVQEIKDVKLGSAEAKIFTVKPSNKYRVILNQDKIVNGPVSDWEFDDLDSATLYAHMCLNQVNRKKMKLKDNLFSIKEDLGEAPAEVKQAFNTLATFFATEDGEGGDEVYDSKEGIMSFAQEYMKEIFGDQYDESTTIGMVDGLIEKYPGEWGKIAGIIKNSVRRKG